MKEYLIAAMSFCSSAFVIAQQVSEEKLKNHLNQIVLTTEFRNFKNEVALNQVARYIENEFNKYSSNVLIQEFEVNGSVYKNVICSFGPSDGERIIIGAHYDVCGNQPGADDNASGVSGLLELSRMLSGKELKYRIDLVAFTLEEPPFFRTENMGSYQHAQSLVKEKAKVKGMISLEMIGFYSENKKSQRYPIGLLKWFYGGKGNYITVVQKTSAGRFARVFKRKMKGGALLPVKSFKAPQSLPGIDFSDHLNYWAAGYSAVMITDTSFYRNANYHQPSDTITTLDIDKMAACIQTVYNALTKMP